MAGGRPGVASGFRSLDEMRITARRAAEIPSQREMFKRLYLNIWGDSAAVTWVDMAVYDEGAGAPVELSDLAGRPVYVGVDLASVSDLAAVYAVAEADDGGWLVHGKQYCPAEQHRKRVADNLPYDTFAESGRLVVTEGNAIDQDRIIADLVELAGELDVREIAVDRWGAVGIPDAATRARLAGGAVRPGLRLHVGALQRDRAGDPRAAAQDRR